MSALDSEREFARLKALVERLLAHGTDQQYHRFFQEYHEADIADVLEQLRPEDQSQFFSQVKPEVSAEVLEEMGLSNQIEIITHFKTELAAKFIEEMEPDDAANLLEELLNLDEEKAAEIFEALPQEDARDIQGLLAYGDDTAGALMTSEFLAIPENLLVSEAITVIRTQNPPDSEVSFYIFIVDSNEKLVGYTTLRNLILAPPDNPIRTIRNDYPVTISASDDQEFVAQQFQKYDVVAMPVLDDRETLVGLITVDDVVDVVVEEATEDIYKLSGTTEVEEEKLISGSLFIAIKSRLPWLFITLLGGLLASVIITRYSNAFSSYLFPLAFSLSMVPLLMGLGGNVGNQSATIIVRGIATGHINTRYPIQTIVREMTVGFSISLVLALTMYGISAAFGYPATLSAIVFVSLVSNVTVAAIIGSSLPLILNRFNIDPAIASAPFISTTLDIMGQLIYFSITLLVIGFLT